MAERGRCLDLELFAVKSIQVKNGHSDSASAQLLVYCPESDFLHLCLLFITLRSLCGMPRIQKRYCSPAELICPVEACRKECRTHSGLTQHLLAKHKDYQPESPRFAAVVNDCIIPSLDSDLSSASANDCDMEMPTSISDSDYPSLAGARDAFGSNRDSVGLDFEIPGGPSPPSESSRPDSSHLIEYHPLMNGM